MFINKNEFERNSQCWFLINKNTITELVVTTSVEGDVVIDGATVPLLGGTIEVPDDVVTDWPVVPLLGEMIEVPSDVVADGLGVSWKNNKLITWTFSKVTLFHLKSIEKTFPKYLFLKNVIV